MPDVNIRKWADAVVHTFTAEGGGQDDYRDLIELAKIIDGNTDLRDNIMEDSVDVDKKVATIKASVDTYNPRLSPVITSILVAGQFRHFLKIAEEAYKRATEDLGAVMAHVWTAYPLTPDELHRLTDALQNRLQRPITMYITVDPKLVGGIAVDVNEEYLDGTIKRRVESMRQVLAEAN